MRIKRKIYLIDPSFQIKFSLYICVIIFISSLIYPLMLHDFLTWIYENILKTSPNFANTLKSKKDALLIFLGLTQLGYTFLIFIISIFFSHKLAGPIYKMKKILKNVRNNEGDQIVYLRKGDYFTDLASEINETLNTFTNHETTKYSNISEISSLLDEIGPSISDEYREKYDEISKKINELQGH